MTWADVGDVVALLGAGVYLGWIFGRSARPRHGWQCALCTFKAASDWEPTIDRVAREHVAAYHPPPSRP